MREQEKPPVDNPIASSADDVLDRATVAHQFAKSIRRLDASDGIVVGVLGAWGYGKSSFVNLMREEFAQNPVIAVVDFNPWMFSGSQQLVDFFFKEIAAELRLKGKDQFKSVADGLDAYGDLLSPLAIIPGFGAWWDRSFKAVRAVAKAYGDRRQGSRTLRDKVSEALRTLDQPVVVVIDDIDRLSTAEIRDIFKLVRLTASFPNLVYLLAFDRQRVEQALDETNVPGRAYLEKIVQLSFDLPAIPKELLRTEILNELNRILGDIEDLRLDHARWPDVFVEIIDPLVGSLRDVTRLALSARPTLESLGSEVEAVDLIGLEALRTFRPQIFALLPRLRTTLTNPGGSFGGREDLKPMTPVDGLIAEAGEEADLVRTVIRRLFPAARRYIENQSYGDGASSKWRREHRVAHIDFANLYFDRVAPSELIAFRRAEQAYSLLSDESAFGAFLDATPPEDLEETIRALGMYENEYPISGIVPGSINLLNRLTEIPHREPAGVFDIFRPDITVFRVVLAMFKMLDDEKAREEAAEAVLAKVPSYSTRCRLIRSFGHIEDQGQKLVSENLAEQLEKNLVKEVLAVPSRVPTKEWDLLRVYSIIADRLGVDFVAPELSEPDLIRSLFRSAQSTNRTQSVESRTVTSVAVLAWDPLVKVIGSEESVRLAVEKLRAVDGDSDLVLLSDRYLEGWRPKEW
ncbi:P-loop NTPase fold protein [Arthrobacter sp. NPDC080031]|uniref:KAP family P-loop NTPase fold protein n=1 Tax=Arthrobacter sp. NPDC080031 TaxID=3155918 RepID=UPI00344BE225